MIQSSTDHTPVATRKNCLYYNRKKRFYNLILPEGDCPLIDEVRFKIGKSHLTKMNLILISSIKQITSHPVVYGSLK